MLLRTFLQGNSYSFMAWFRLFCLFAWLLFVFFCGWFLFCLCFLFVVWFLLVFGLSIRPWNTHWSLDYVQVRNCPLLWSVNLTDMQGNLLISFRQVQTCWTTWRKPWRRWTEKKPAHPLGFGHPTNVQGKLLLLKVCFPHHFQMTIPDGIRPVNVIGFSAGFPSGIIR